MTSRKISLYYASAVNLYYGPRTNKNCFSFIIKFLILYKINSLHYIIQVLNYLFKKKNLILENIRLNLPSFMQKNYFRKFKSTVSTF